VLRDRRSKDEGIYQVRERGYANRQAQGLLKWRSKRRRRANYTKARALGFKRQAQLRFWRIVYSIMRDQIRSSAFDFK
jgi:hypothetical protein